MSVDVTGPRPHHSKWLAAAMSLAVLTAVPARAQLDLPPAKGGMTYELGMPPVYKGRAGFESQWYRPDNNGTLGGLLNLGVSRDLGSPVVGMAALRLEGYGGVRDQEFDGGGRALFEIPTLYLGAGVDYNGVDNVADFLLTFDLPLRRGGVFGRGTTLALRYLPARDNTLGIGINVPLWGRNIGETRPFSDNIRLESRKPRRVQVDQPGDELESTLAELRERAHWVARLSQPFAEPEGADAVKAMAPGIEEMKAHMAGVDAAFPAGHTLPEEIRVYHLTLDRAFSLAAGGDGVTPAGQALSARARAILLNEVLLPYNYLLGQRKKNDSLINMIAIAQTGFASEVLSRHDLPGGQIQRVFLVFQTLCDLMEENRRDLRERWGDSRLVWMPLQYSLTPDQHDSQEEIDAIIGQATKRPFTSENRVWYVINEQFQWEMARSVRAAEIYHVLWIHDYRGRNGEGEPDAIAYSQTLNYLEALTERVQAYDRVGRLPQYFLFLDQHYFEINKSRLFLRVLHDPLGCKLKLSDTHRDWEEKIRQRQALLREAVATSRLLQVGASQYGQAWLRNLVKVQINITNPADASFRSWHSAGIVPIPDNMMRDHRKIAFYDITEADPYRGIAMFTGMGIGEHYVGANWEDRAIMIQGPGALAVKQAARGLLTAQGFKPEEIPYPLREQPKADDYAEQVEAERIRVAPEWLGDRGGVLQLHNETGFHDKPINVAKAVLYSLMPEGSLLKVPDSLWQSYVYASLLGGSTLRGCRVLVIAPTLASAPSAAAPTLARAHGLLGRLIAFSNGMEAELTRVNGLLKVGLYAPRQGVGDIAGRFRQATENAPNWISRIHPPNPAVVEAARNAGAQLDSMGYTVRYLSQGGNDGEESPKIHLKANFLASEAAWKALYGRPELGNLVREQIAYLASQGMKPGNGESAPDVRVVPQKLVTQWFDLVHNMLSDLPPGEREKIVYYLTAGSTNMNYRSMVMDGEVMIVLGGWESLFGFLDFLLLPGLCDWVETPEQLDALLPPPGGFTRSIAGLLRLSL